MNENIADCKLQTVKILINTKTNCHFVPNYFFNDTMNAKVKTK